jgi:hypothetical protein
MHLKLRFAIQDFERLVRSFAPRIPVTGVRVGGPLETRQFSCTDVQSGLSSGQC